MSAVTEGAKLYSGVVLSVGAGKALPKDFVATLVAKNKSGVGVTFCVPENTEVIPARSDSTDADRVEGSVNLAREKFPDAPLNFWLGNANKGASFKKDDLQPFVMLTDGKNSDGKDKATVCVMLDGDFPPYIKDNGHSEHYNFAHEFLKPKLEKLNKLVGGDINKLVDAIDEDDILARDIPMGAVLFIFGNGKTKVCLKNYETFRETSFGFSSDTYGWVETKAPAAGGSDDLSNMLARSVPASNVTIPPSPKTDTAIPAQGRTYVLLKCPKEAAKSKGDIKAWYVTKTIDGVAPDKYWERPEAKCKVPESWKGPVYYEVTGQQPTKYKSFQELNDAITTKSNGGTAPTATATADAPKTEEPAVEPAADDDKQTDDGDATNGDYDWPAIDEEERKPLEEAILKFQDENKNFTQDPKSMQEWVERRETFREAMGLDNDVKVSGIPVPPEFTPEFEEDMCESKPVAFFTIYQDWKLAAKLALARVAELEARIGQLDTAPEPQPKPQPQAGVIPPSPTGSRMRKSQAA